MKALSSETVTFCALMDDNELRKEASGFAEGAAVRLYNGAIPKDKISVRITVEIIPSSGRVGSNTQKAMLQALMAGDGARAWYNGPGKYLFDFAQQKFMWGNRDLYLTAGEQFALYKKLIRGEALDRMVTARLRAKFGQDFLEGHI